MKKSTIENFYKMLPIAYADHQMIFDENRKPIDFIYLDVNEKYEKLMSFSVKDIIGKKITELIPGVKTNTLNWINTYGQAVLENKPIEFDEYIEFAKKWCHVYLFTAENDRFITILADITDIILKSTEQSILFTILNNVIFEIDDNLTVVNVVSPDEILLTLPKNGMIGKKIKKLIPSEHWLAFTNAFEKAKNCGAKERLVFHYQVNGFDKWLQADLKYTDIEYTNLNKHHKYIMSVSDITEQIILKQKQEESERSKSVLLSHLPGIAYRCKFDKEWTMEFISEGCLALTGYHQESLLNNKEKSFNDIILPKYREQIWEKWVLAVNSHTSIKDEYEIITASGEIKWVLEQGQAVFDNSGNVIALEGLIIDITDRINRELEVKYLNEHDSFTGLYNRKYFIDEMKRLDVQVNLPLSVIIGDINGMRLINNAFGQSEGDRIVKETAEAIRSVCGESVVLARTGGDEYSVLLPKTDYETALLMMEKIKDKCSNISPNKYTENSNRISLGCNTKISEEENLSEIYKIAEDYMFKRKMLNRKGSHGAIINSILATLFAKSHETEQHALRLGQLSKMIGEELRLPQSDLDMLELFSMLHDIGKIGIDDRILNKPGKLDEIEWEIMKKHPEIGYKIALSSPELEQIAYYVLTHHEHWDGSGYPKGLREDDIPLLSRILAVADAYDALTETRVYKKAVSREEAIREINCCAGTQFDPGVVQIFNQVVQGTYLMK